MRTLEVGPASELFSSISVFGNFLSTASLVILHIQSLSAFLRCILENPLGLARVLTVHLIGTSPTCDNSPRIRMSSPSPISFILPRPSLHIVSRKNFSAAPTAPNIPHRAHAGPLAARTVLAGQLGSLLVYRLQVPRLRTPRTPPRPLVNYSACALPHLPPGVENLFQSISIHHVSDESNYNSSFDSLFAPELIPYFSSNGRWSALILHCPKTSADLQR